MSRFTITPKQNESFLGTGLRNVATAGARGLEAVLGKTGDVAAGLTSLVNKGLESIGTNPKLLPQPPEFLPTSQTLKEQITEPLAERFLPQGYLSPQSPKAETAGNIVSFLSGTLAPPFGVSSRTSIPRALGTSILGEVGAQGVKELGGGPLAQEAGRIGTSALTSMFGGRKMITNQKDAAYSKARTDIQGKRLPKNISKKLKQKNTHFLDKLNKTVTDEEKFFRTTSGKIDNIVSQAKPPIDELWDAKININNKLSQFSPKSPEFRLGSQLVSNINEALQKYGSKVNKDFIINFNMGEELHKGLNAASNITKFLNKNVNIERIVKKPLTKLLLFSLPHILPHKATLGIGAGIGSAFGARELSKFSDLWRKSPIARETYNNLLKGALEQNANVVIRNAHKLDNEIAKYEKSSGQKRFTVHKGSSEKTTNTI